MSEFDKYLTGIGKSRDTATDLDEIQWLRSERQRLRLTDAEREAIERACCSLGGVIDRSAECSEWDAEARQTLLSLLERTK